MFKKKLPSCYLSIPCATAPSLIGSIVVAATTIPKIIKTINGIKSTINDTINIINNTHDNDDVVSNSTSQSEFINKEEVEKYFFELMKQYRTHDSNVNETTIVEIEKGEVVELE